MRCGGLIRTVMEKTNTINVTVRYKPHEYEKVVKKAEKAKSFQTRKGKEEVNVAGYIRDKSLA